MRIVVTGGDGFIGQNLRVRLRELGQSEVVSVDRDTGAEALRSALASADFVFHLAGVNRPSDPAEFHDVNTALTAQVCEALAATGRRVPLVLSSSTQAALDNPYGRSKRGGEAAVEQYAASTGAPVYILRLTNVFGKWSRPNYNSAVATFCHNLSRGQPITITDPAAPLTLLYIDDAVAAMVRLLDADPPPSGVIDVGPTFPTTVGEVAAIIRSFVDNRETLLIPGVGSGLTRALYATYLSFLPPDDFAYDLRQHVDPRGAFAEMLKTRDSGQVSYFTAPPGVTRGEHYHHTKTEKFLVVQGTARFGFRHLVTDQRHELIVDGAVPRIVETVPGWVHSITNVGETVMIVLLWASEVFDPSRPDTIAASVNA